MELTSKCLGQRRNLTLTILSDQEYMSGVKEKLAMIAEYGDKKHPAAMTGSGVLPWRGGDYRAVTKMTEQSYPEPAL